MILMGIRPAERKEFFDRIRRLGRAPVDILPLVIFRIGFGLLMVVSVLRFIVKGWVHEQYIAPTYHFSFISALQPIPGRGMYLVFALIAISALMIAAGLYYRFSVSLFFITFTYVELIDKSYYLNHYYLISLLGLLLIFLPTHQKWSLDIYFNRVTPREWVPGWTLWALRLQIGLVYIFAGLAKINPDWLIEGLPLAIWLPARASLPVLGPLLSWRSTAIVLSWAGMFFDTTIVFWLVMHRTRKAAYAVVAVFHGMTAVLFPLIGMFPYIMIFNALIFFDGRDWRAWFKLPAPSALKQDLAISNFRLSTKSTLILAAFFVLQAVLPFRHYAHPGDVFWTEQGFRFSWRVMLVEKTGSVIFRAEDPSTDRSWLIFPSDHLTPQQEKQFAFQPDMILQFAADLEAGYREAGLSDIAIRADSYVSVNGRRSQVLLDPAVDLTRPGLKVDDILLNIYLPP